MSKKHQDHDYSLEAIPNSDKKGFIGGCVSSLEESIIVFGDLNKIDSDGRIREFITSKNLNIIEFEGLDVIDYGGIIWTY